MMEITDKPHAGALGAGRVGNDPLNTEQNTPRLSMLLATMDKALDRLQTEIGKYSSMNNVLSGSVPQSISQEECVNEGTGLVSSLMGRAELLRSLCNELDAENSRLSEVVDHE